MKWVWYLWGSPHTVINHEAVTQIWYLIRCVILVSCEILKLSDNLGLGTGDCHASYRADSKFAPSQWETVLLCNDVSHWLGPILESALILAFKTIYVTSEDEAQRIETLWSLIMCYLIEFGIGYRFFIKISHYLYLIWGIPIAEKWWYFIVFPPQMELIVIV